MRTRSSCAPRNRCVRCALGVGLARPKRLNSCHLVPKQPPPCQDQTTRHHKRRLAASSGSGQVVRAERTFRSLKSARSERSCNRSCAAKEPLQPPVGPNTTQRLRELRGQTPHQNCHKPWFRSSCATCVDFGARGTAAFAVPWT